MNGTQHLGWIFSIVFSTNHNKNNLLFDFSNPSSWFKKSIWINYFTKCILPTSKLSNCISTGYGEWSRASKCGFFHISSTSFKNLLRFIMFAFNSMKKSCSPTLPILKENSVHIQSKCTKLEQKCYYILHNWSHNTQCLNEVIVGWFLHEFH